MKTLQAPWASRRLWRLAAIGVAFLALGLAFASQYKFVIVFGTSMLPTLKPGDVLLVDKRAYKQVEPGRGDVVVARSAAGLVVKRVVGLPGEEVAVKDGQLYINRTLAAEKHPIEPGYLDVGEGKLLPGDFATLGDNRAVAPVSAIHPIVTKADILGKAVMALGKEIR